MTAKAILRAYGLWLLGVLSAAAAAYFLHRSRVISYELADEYSDNGYPLDADDDDTEDLPARVSRYTLE